MLVQEGGYNIDVIAQSVAACTSVLLGDHPPPLVLTERGSSSGARLTLHEFWCLEA